MLRFLDPRIRATTRSSQRPTTEERNGLRKLCAASTPSEPPTPRPQRLSSRTRLRTNGQPSSLMSTSYAAKLCAQSSGDSGTSEINFWIVSAKEACLKSISHRPRISPRRSPDDQVTVGTFRLEHLVTSQYPTRRGWAWSAKWLGRQSSRSVSDQRSI